MYLVLCVSLAAFFVPLALLGGVDLSGWIYPPPLPSPLLINPGDSVELLLAGHFDSGVPFMVNHTLNATIGAGALVPGLEVGLLGLEAGDSFDITVQPADAYGPWNASRLVSIPRTEDHARAYTMSSTSFQNLYGSPFVGEHVGTQPWPSTVTAVSSGSVALRYEPALNTTASLYIHWSSTVVAFNNTTVTTSNDLYVGDSFEIVSKSSGTVTQVQVTAENATAFTLDLNPPLAGKTLHYEGAIIAIKPGPGPVRTRAGAAVGIGSDTCERCHADAGFQAVDGSASAARAGGSIVVNLTIDNPWLQEDVGVEVTASAFNVTATTASASAGFPSLGPSGSQAGTLSLPDVGNASSVTVLVNVTAHHVHASGGKPTDLPYELTIKAPLGAARLTTPARPAPPPASVDFWLLVGRITGFAALGVACLSAVQGYRRHLRRAPRFKWPPWLTLHFSMSLFATVLTIIHAVAFMSTTYRGIWSWDIDVGVISLLALGVMGATGIVLAKWTTLRAPKIRKWHFWLMLGMLVTGFLHTFVSGTTLRMLFGA
jgi:FKBP-type peptidyl-prolyl cis-trans isomerase 2